MTDMMVAQNVANIHIEPSTESTLSSQAMMGERVKVEGSTGDFSLVTTEDRYSGWIRTVQLEAAWDTSEHLQTTIASLFADIVADPDDNAEVLTKLTAGTSVHLARRPEIGPYVPIVLPAKKVGYVHKLCLNITHASETTVETIAGIASSSPEDLRLLKQRVIEHVGSQSAAVAARFIGTPYLWGGTSSFGLDCSGLVQLCYRLSGLQLLRDAWQQFDDRRFVKLNSPTLELAELQAGDLVVFSTVSTRRPTHIGLAVGDGRFIHSLSGFGTRIDDCGSPRFNEIFVGAVRLSPDADLAVEFA